MVSRVGQDALKVALIKTDAAFGGESSAHYNYPSRTVWTPACSRSSTSGTWC